jgi:hypothetical protein
VGANKGPHVVAAAREEKEAARVARILAFATAGGGSPRGLTLRVGVF